MRAARKTAPKTTQQRKAIAYSEKILSEKEVKDAEEVQELRRRNARVYLTATVETIDAATASEYIRTMMPNRAKNQSRINSYSRMMLGYEWGVTNATIAFTQDGYLCDGQHRLLALITAAKTRPDIKITTVVIRGIDRDYVKHIDNGQSRTILQHYQIQGTPTKGLGPKISACKACFIGGRSVGRNTEKITVSSPTIMTLTNQYFDALSFAVKLTKKPANKAPVHAVIARAYCNLKEVENGIFRLNQFIEVLNTGQVGEAVADSAAIALREYFSSRGSAGMSSQARQMYYRLTEYALDAFMAGREVRSISEKHAVSKELFPVVDFD